MLTFSMFLLSSLIAELLSSVSFVSLSLSPSRSLFIWDFKCWKCANIFSLSYNSLIYTFNKEVDRKIKSQIKCMYRYLHQGWDTCLLQLSISFFTFFGIGCHFWFQLSNLFLKKEISIHVLWQIRRKKCWYITKIFLKTKICYSNE